MPKRILTLLIGTATLLTVPAIPASAAASKAPAETHCVTEVMGQESDGELVLAPETCFAEFDQAMDFAGSPELAEFDRGAELFEAERSGELSSAMMLSSTLATHFDGASYTGSSITVSGSNCSGGYTNLSASWTDRVSSTYMGICSRARHYDYVNKGGGYEDIYASGGNLGPLNNDADSISYH